MTKRTIVLALLSAFLLSASLPGLGFEWLVWIGFIPLLAAVERLSPARGFVVGLIPGGAVAAVTLSFIPSAGRAIGLASAAGWLVFLALAAYYGLYTGAFALLAGLLLRRSGSARLWVLLSALLIPAAWAGLEFLHSRIFPGLPWTFIFFGYFLWRFTILIQVADITGVYGLSFLVLLVNAGFYLLVTRKKVLPAAAAAGVVVAILFYGGHRLSARPRRADESAVRVAILQGNVPAGVKWDDARGEMIAGTYLELCRRANDFRPDLVIWTETAIPWPVEEGDDLVEAALAATADSRAAHIIGTPAPAGKGRYHNSALLVLPDGEAAGRYDKVRLLSFIEAGGPKNLFSPGTPAASGYLPGRGYRLLSTPRGRAGVTICNENFYPELGRRAAREGAEFFLNLTNDAWWPDRFRLTGHFLFNVFRSIENRRPSAVASNVGVSALVDDRGRVINSAPILEPYLLAGEIEKSRDLTFYTRRGDIFAVSSLLAASGGITFSLFRT